MKIEILKRDLTRHISNIPGWRTNRKIVVIESDDWGSIRMPSREVYDSLIAKGIRVDNLSYNRYDSLASEEDLTALFEVLTSFKDKNGNPAVITANTIVANPDFDKIKASDFQGYFYEPFTETLKRYPEHQKSFDLWKQGISTGIFKPQFHGREHLNVVRWLKALRENISNVHLAFELEMYDLSEDDQISENTFVDALNFESEDEFDLQKLTIIEGLKLFEQLFGYKSTTFIAPCYTWSRRLNKTLHENGVTAFQGGWYQFEPKTGKEHNFKKQFHYTGQKNNLGQLYLTRNASFEPSILPKHNFMDDILSRMEIAFRWGKPLILGSHRVNFIGFIDPENRKQNLVLFKSLLKEIIKRWPEVEFMSSDQLVTLMLNK